MTSKNFTLSFRPGLILLVIALLAGFTSNALVAPSMEPASSDKPASGADMLRNMDVNEFLSLTPSKYRELTGEKLSVTQKISLKIAQKKMKKAIRNNQTIDASVKAQAIDGSDFNIGGFILGLLLSVVGVLIAYLIGDTSVIKWAWIGFGVFLIIFLLAVLL